MSEGYTSPSALQADRPATPEVSDTSQVSAAWSTVVVLAVLYWFGTLDRQMMSLLVTPIKQSLGMTDVQIGLVQGPAFALFFTAASLPIGWLVDRVSRRAVIFWGTIAWSIAAASSGLARSFAQLFGARAGVGAGEATLQPAAFAIIADLFPAERLAMPLSIFLLGANIGSGMSYVLGGTVVDWVAHSAAIVLPAIGPVAPWQVAFLMTGLPGLLLAFLVFAVAEPKRMGVTGQAEEHSTFRDLGRHYRKHGFFYLSHNLGFAMCMAFVVGLLAWNPAFLSRHYGWDIGRIGLWLGGSQIAAALLGLAFHGWAVDRLFRGGMKDAHLRYFTVMCPLGGALAAAAYLVDDPFVMLALFNLSYFCVMAYPGIGAASLQIATPAALRGKASAVYLMGLNLVGAMLGPLLVAAITEYVFGSEAHIGRAMSLFAAITMALATFLFAIGRSPMRRALGAPHEAGR